LAEAATDADAEHVRECEASVDLRSSPVKQPAKSSAKSKKRSTERKRKGTSWYNVRLDEVVFALFFYHFAGTLILVEL